VVATACTPGQVSYPCCKLGLEGTGAGWSSGVTHQARSEPSPTPSQEDSSLGFGGVRLSNKRPYQAPLGKVDRDHPSPRSDGYPRPRQGREDPLTPTAGCLTFPEHRTNRLGTKARDTAILTIKYLLKAERQEHLAHVGKAKDSTKIATGTSTHMGHGLSPLFMPTSPG
jgi:hypothetical protein